MSEQKTSFKEDMVGMSKDIGYIKKALEENKAEHIKIINMLNETKDKNEERYAAKWTETAVKSFIGLILATVILALLGTVLIN